MTKPEILSDDGATAYRAVTSCLVRPLWFRWPRGHCVQRATAWHQENRTMPTVTNRPTKWSGIYVTSEAGHYWIMDDNGGEEYVGTAYPTDDRLNAYHDAIC